MRRHVLGFTTALALGSQALAQTPAPAPVPAAHPWYVRADAGGWMLCVKSYSGPAAKALAEELAKDIRETYKTPAYLFERGSDEKRKQNEFIAKETARQTAMQQEFLKKADQLREEAVLKGMDFIETAPKVRVPKVKSIDEQWAVLIGGWADDVTARQALSTVRTWAPPKNQQLMDSGVMVRTGADGKKSGETAYLNPYQSAHVVPNPAAPRVESAESAETLKALFRLNEKEPLTAMQITKPYTLVVKSFHPSRKGLRDKDGEKSVVQKLFGTNNDGQEMQACANQAGELCKALRNPNFKPRPLDAYVLHTLYGSCVTVGGYDGPDDPTLGETIRLVESVTFTVTRQDSGKSDFNVKMFDSPIPMAVPRRP